MSFVDIKKIKFIQKMVLCLKLKMKNIPEQPMTIQNFTCIQI